VAYTSRGCIHFKNYIHFKKLLPLQEAQIKVKTVQFTAITTTETTNFKSPIINAANTTNGAIIWK